jgi:hypothetical protein
MATIVLYAVDLEDLSGWVGRGDARALAAARRALGEDEEADWEPGEIELLHRLLDRVVMDGQLYEGLAPEERYYLTQLLIDLFDEFVDSEAVSDELPMRAVEEALAPARRASGAAGEAAQHLVQGRELGGPATLRRPGQDLEEVIPYFGYVTRDELPALLEALQAPAGGGARPTPGGRRGSGPLRALQAAGRACVESERDLLSFIT